MAPKARRQKRKGAARRPQITTESLAVTIEKSERAHGRLIMRCFKQFLVLEPQLAKELLNVWEKDERPAARWLCKAHPELGGVSPLRAAAEGRQGDVRRILGWFEHGIPG